MATQHASIRKALAGVAILQDPSRSMASVLTGAGYSPATARSPTEKGLGAPGCVDAAQKAFGKGDLGKILSLSRERMQEKLETLPIAETDLRDIARAFDIVEKWCGGKELPQLPGGVVDPRQSLRWVREVVMVSLERGLITTADLPKAPGESAPTTLDVGTGTTPQVIDVPVVTSPASDNSQYVNLPSTERPNPSAVSDF